MFEIRGVRTAHARAQNLYIGVARRDPIRSHFEADDVTSMLRELTPPKVLS